jgi:hypothetical protein
VLLAVLVATAACATTRGPGRAGPALPETPAARVAAPGFGFDRDTFAFPNDIRARHPDSEDLYANYCFVLARAIRQFYAFARFDPAAPRLGRAEYVERVRQVVARPPWRAPLPPAERVTIPGYAGLRDFSRAQERTVKEGLGGRFWTWVHWTNWRVTIPVTRGHQAHVAREIIDDLRQGRLVQLLVTNWPKPELNHTLVVYEARRTARGLDLTVWDPNDPAKPGVISFDDGEGRFRATRVFDTEPGTIRVFRMYYSRLL